VHHPDRVDGGQGGRHFLTPDEFEQAYAAVFPGAEFTPSYRTMAMHWKAAATS
jgi:hypothetical protein